MRFTRFNIYRLAVLFIITILLVSCSPSVAHKMDNDLGGNDTGSKICSQSPEGSLFDLQAASVMRILIGDDEFGELGMDGAEEIADALYSPMDSFCGLSSSEELLSNLEEIQGVYDSGDLDQADELLLNLLEAIDDDQFTEDGSGKVAALLFQTGAARTRRIVKNYLDVAGRAAYWGNDEKADTALQAAVDTYSTWAADAVDTANIKEALRIAAEAQLLGIDGLDDQALERAHDLIALDLAGERKSYKPCSATKADTKRLLDTTAKALLLGVEVNTYEIMAVVEEWQEIQRKRAKGEDVPQCEGWSIEMLIDNGWDSGYHNIVWNGVFQEREDGSLNGTGTGSITTHVEITCVNVLSGEEYMSTTDVTGSFEFGVEGRRAERDGAAIFQFLFPAEITISGEDTCNEFDPETYLPSYVIQDINVYGGVENYDMEADLIYLAVNAQDGATAEFETLIGPLFITLTNLNPGD